MKPQADLHPLKGIVKRRDVVSAVGYVLFIIV